MFVERLLAITEVRALVANLGERTIYRLISLNRFPKPVRLASEAAWAGANRKSSNGLRAASKPQITKTKRTACLKLTHSASHRAACKPTPKPKHPRRRAR
jgi:hypothetical protein